jgi:3-phenylpropionate/cinnamic acid dioxygenase small subunit
MPEGQLFAEVYDLLVRYAESIDRRDLDAVGSCFASDASAIYAGNLVEGGRQAIVDYLTDQLTASAASTHAVGNIQFTETGNGELAVESIVTATHVVPEGDRALIRTRGLRYSDTVVREGAGLLIKQRVHRALWSTEMNGEAWL